MLLYGGWRLLSGGDLVVEVDVFLGFVYEVEISLEIDGFGSRGWHVVLDGASAESVKVKSACRNNVKEKIEYG